MRAKVNTFIASSAELKAEREKYILLINQLNKSHKHLQLEPIEWEYDLVHGNNPGFETVQDAINPKLEESDLAVFIFYSKIGKYTRQEFELVTKQGKRLFAFFKTGFSPAKNTLAAYSELLDFRESLDDTVLYKEYTDLTDFENQLFPNLNLFLVENYPPVKEREGGDATTAALSQSNLTLIRMLEEKEREIKELKERQLLPGKEIQDELRQLIREKEAIQNELLQSEEIRKQQAKDKEVLEQQLSPQKEKDNLKARALEEVEKGNYAEAETYLKESAKEKINDVASTFFELAKIKKLQLRFAEAFDYYELAVKINPENSLYLNETGVMANDLGHYDKAIDYHRNSLAIALTESGEEHPQIASRYNNLGSAYDNKGEYDKAINYYNRSLAILQKFLPTDHPYIAICQQNLALAQAALEKQNNP